MPKIENLFPTPIFFETIDRCFSDIEINYFNSLKITDNLLNYRSEKTYILDSPELSNLKKDIEDNVKLYFSEIFKPNNSLEIYITQSWLNISSVGEQHHIHNHPNSFISGTFYISADKTIDSIAFSKIDFSPVRLIPTSYNSYNSPAWNYSVGEKDLVLFPSTLYHYVDPVKESKTRKERISISFNTFLKGNLGSENLLSELKL
jgi:uncharacterized protein (TIGR02466 family)